ncbi:MAG: phosphonopyruvate decarboxylase [Chloroflexi bacterium]|nr:phosphonopyruvate decarboxylase [Chloroflexota bacterium]MCI0787012.1 phosphonopyruvate decarboxylase [Chloroflexota bacterium]MCI0792224.1 phosphonopyruvate decarboxylase [Chloroflexota bacterium]MCI0798797.1 phosphonopyruvate decarboxylase [Chloroflexota bacterium]MCI0858972.1 phosphonopyruvate decarboxylase [Chloroflexota bacterium]
MAMERIEALSLISQQFPEDPVVFTCGATCREMVASGRRENHLYVVDSMGLVSPIVLGLSLGLEEEVGRRVVGVEGDGAMLTNLNSLATIGFLQPKNLLLIVLDNQRYGSTGGQYTFTTRLELASIARECGLRTWMADDLESFKQSLEEASALPGPNFIRMKIAPGNAEVPLLLDDPVTLSYRFTRWLSENTDAH